jgi:hypothetical protein
MYARAKWWLALSVLATACGGASSASNESFAGPPFLVVPSDDGKLTIEVRTAPEQPPQRGVGAVQFVVKDAQGAAIDGLDVSSTLWMPAMGHGPSVQPVSSAQGHGTYVLDNVYLFMAGHWELRTDFSGSVTDRATPSFDVP